MLKSFEPTRTSPAGRIRFELLTDLHYVVQAEIARLHLERVNINLDLPVGSAIRLRNRGALHIGDLIAHLELRYVFQVRFVQSLPLQRHQANWLRRSVHAQHHWGQCARRQAP